MDAHFIRTDDLVDAASNLSGVEAQIVQSLRAVRVDCVAAAGLAARQSRILLPGKALRPVPMLPVASALLEVTKRPDQQRDENPDDCAEQLGQFRDLQYWHGGSCSSFGAGGAARACREV
jgi:hypothetical protein